MQFSTSIIALMATLGVVNSSPLPYTNNTHPEFIVRSAVALEKRDTHDGIATIYYQGGGTGSCGHTHTDESYIVALGNYWWDTYGEGYFCDRIVVMTNTGPAGDESIGGEGNVVRAKVADTCPECDENHLDLSKGAWSALTNDAADSEVDIHWYFCPDDNPDC